jgi:hypothetical protein
MYFTYAAVMLSYGHWQTGDDLLKAYYGHGHYRGLLVGACVLPFRGGGLWIKIKECSVVTSDDKRRRQ